MSADTGGAPLLEAVDLHKSFGPTPALDGAGISIWPGDADDL